MTRRMEMKIKDFIYKYSIRLFILIVAYLIVSFPFQYTQEKMNDVSQPVRWPVSYTHLDVYKRQIQDVLIISTEKMS